MEFHNSIFLGVGVAISVLGFFLKKEARKTEEMTQRVGTLEIMLAKNEVRDCERWKVAHKLMEDRRNDVIKIYDKLDSKK